MDLAKANIEIIKSIGDSEFAKLILAARRDFLKLRLRHEPALHKIYVDAANNVAKELKNLKPTIGDLTRNHLAALEKALRDEADLIYRKSKATVEVGMVKSVEASAKPLDAYLINALKEAKAPIDIAKLQRGFAEVNRSAVEAFWIRTKKGLTISDRLWEQSQNARSHMKTVIETGLASGRDAVQVAKDLENYVRNGTLAEEYPKMMARVGNRVPKNLSYEALRLARSEYSMAFMEGVYSRGRTNPAYIGSKYMLSDSHPEPDICDDLAEADLYGMGAGVYKKGEEPPYSHPNCICYTIPVVLDRDQFVNDIKRWINDPSEVDYMEDWYQNIYRQGG